MHASPSDVRNLDLDLDGAATRAAQVAADARAALGHSIDRARTVATDVTARGRAAVAHAGGYVRHLGDLAERYVGAKIKRRVKPPIVLALVVAGVALVVAVAALATRRR